MRAALLGVDLGAARRGAARATVVAVAALAACKPSPPVVEHSAPPSPGLAIAIYEDGDRMVALVDDRRTIEVHDGEVVLEQLDAGASLASLVVEPASARGFGIGPCRREAASSVRCAAHGATGSVFVRIVYASSTLAFSSRHVIAVADERATIATTYALPMPAWGRRAVITLYDGVPGGPRAPALLGTLDVELDGTTVTMPMPAREVKARRLVVFDPLRRIGDDDPARGDNDTLGGVLAWEWLELVDTTLPPGELDVRADLDTDDPVAAEVPTSAAATVGGALRIPLRPDPMVRGRRERHVAVEHERQVDQLRFWLTNEDARAHTVLIEETLRAAAGHKIVEGSPHRPTIVGDVARLELEVPATGTARATFSVAYTP